MSFSNTLLIIFSVLVIVILAASFLYFAVVEPSVLPISVANVKQEAVAEVEPQVVAEKTEITFFSVPETLSETVKQGDCIASMAQPYRQDAFKCKVLNAVYDPCFITGQENTVFCKMNPISGTPVVIKNIKDLPKISLPENIKNNWAWFIELKDGTFCSPYIIKRLIVDGQVVYYGCKSAIKNQATVLMGELDSQELIWKAKKAIIIKDGINWKIQTSEDVGIRAIWK